MIVNKNSWHYRWNVKMGNKWKTQGKNTLCSYFWHTVWNILAPTVATSIVVLFLSLLGLIITEESGINTWWSFPIGTVAFSVTGAVIFGLMYAGERGISKLQDVLHDRPAKPDSLLKAYLKAKKRKVCPFIEFK